MCEKCDAIAHKLGLRDSLQLEQVFMTVLLRETEEHRQDIEKRLDEEVQSRLSDYEKYAAIHMVDKCVLNALVRMLVTYTATHSHSPVVVSLLLAEEFHSTLDRQQKNTDPSLS